MNVFFITCGVFMLAFFFMAIGAIIAGKVIKGSCGGIGALFGSSACDMCALKDKCESSGVEICEEGESDCSTKC